MVLLLDCGNTHTVFGCADSEGKLSQIFRMETNRKKTGFEYASDIRQIFRSTRTAFAAPSSPPSSPSSRSPTAKRSGWQSAGMPS